LAIRLSLPYSLSLPDALPISLFSVAGLTPSAFAQDTLAQESSRRQAILARLPADAAKRVFGLATSPAPGPARPIGDYTKGCVAGDRKSTRLNSSHQIISYAVF